MEYRIAKDNETPTITLTTDSPQSHYGIPVLRYEMHDCKDFGPMDIIPNFHNLELFDTPITAGSIIFTWADNRKRTRKERNAARLYLSQSSNPQFQLAPESWFVENNYYQKDNDFRPL